MEPSDEELNENLACGVLYLNDLLVLGEIAARSYVLTPSTSNSMSASEVILSPG